MSKITFFHGRGEQLVGVVPTEASPPSPLRSINDRIGARGEVIGHAYGNRMQLITKKMLVSTAINRMIAKQKE